MMHNPIQTLEDARGKQALRRLFNVNEFQQMVHTLEDVLLLVEVADSSLVYDRDVKGPLYAHSEIPELWTVTPPRRAIARAAGYGLAMRSPLLSSPTRYARLRTS
jgi:hypothetical protein